MGEHPPEDRPWFTVLLVPERGRGEVRQLTLGWRRGRQLLVGGALALSFALTLAVWGLFAVWGTGDRAHLAEENFFLREQLFEIERRLQQTDESVRRLQLYDSRLRALLGEKPERPDGQGPISPEEAMALGIDVTAPPDTAEPGLMDQEPMDGLGEEYPTAGFGRPLSAAESWAVDLHRRASSLSERLTQVELRAGAMAETLEDWVAGQAAYPQLWPVKGVLTSGFGYRISPIFHKRKFHNGLDIAASWGSPVFAVAPGTVATAEWDTGYGRLVEIDHGYGVYTRYGHNSRMVVTVGDWVEAGDLIATVGSTGMSTGPHVHFEVLIDGQHVDPLDFLPQ